VACRTCPVGARCAAVHMPGGLFGGHGRGWALPNMEQIPRMPQATF
jgi:hypothetical protein